MLYASESSIYGRFGFGSAAPDGEISLQRSHGAFRRDIEMARLAAERDPPNYFLAGSVAGSCSYCHEGQR